MLDGRGTPDRPSRRNGPYRTRLLSIRARLIVLSLIVMAPLMFERLHGLLGARALRTEDAQTKVVELAQQGVEAQREIIDSVRALLQAIARSYARLPFDVGECN